MNFYTNVLQYGNTILVREVKDGERTTRRVKYQPTLFDLIPRLKETGYKTLDGQNVKPHKFDCIKDAKRWSSERENQDIVFGNTQYPYCWISDEFPNQIEWSLDKMLMVTIDIEVECENGFPKPEDAIEPILAITVKNHQSKRIVVWGVNDFHNYRDDVTYIKCKNEKDLLEKFLGFWETHIPDIITGWNTEFFDIPYLCNRIINIFDEGEDQVKRLSPWKNIFSREVYQMGRTHQVYTLDGIAALDYFDLYRKFTYTNQERYTLDHIAFVELGERKSGNPYDTFREWYTKDYQSFIEYNINDVELVDKLEDKMKLCLTMAYEAKVNFTDVLGTVRFWDIIIYNHLCKKKIVIPPKKQRKKVEKYEGAYVKEPQIGIHKWVMSFDLNSLYPHLIMQYNISPETLIPSKEKSSGDMVNKILDGKVKNNTEYCMAPNGAFFRKDKRGFLPELMETIYNDRVKYKKLLLEAEQEYENTKDKSLLKVISRYNNIQMAKKISLNSAYGAIGNHWFRYFDLRNAEAITTSGQLAIRWIERDLNIYLNKILETDKEDYVIASDTDSVYLTFDKLVSKVFGESPEIIKVVKFLDKVATDKLEPFIDKSYQALAKLVKAYDQKMIMGREVIADKGIWTAKKRYILNVYDNEGVRYKKPKLKIMGIEAVKSSTPAPCRDKLKEALKIIMNGDEKTLNTFIREFREEFMALPPEEIAYPRSVNGVEKYTDNAQNTYNIESGETIQYGFFKSRAPIHVKGAILYNHLVAKNKLSNKYPYILEGEKISWLYLKEPNAYQSSAFSFITKMPKELDLHKFIDYNLQYEKSFIEPLKFITDKIKWAIDGSYGSQGTLEDFF